MAEFPVNPYRQDPYKGFKFQVVWDGRVVAGVSKVSPLLRRTEVIEHRDGASPSHSVKSPGRTSFEPITLGRGITHDPAFEEWANQVYSTQGDAAMSLRNLRKDVLLRLLNEQGTVVMAYQLYRCWVSEYAALPELDANEAVTAIERLVLVTEGWQRDLAVTEPAQT